MEDTSWLETIVKKSVDSQIVESPEEILKKELDSEGKLRINTAIEDYINTKVNKKTLYTNINKKRKEKYKREKQENYNTLYNEVNDAITINELQSKNNEQIFYGLMNNEYDEKLKDISGIELTNKRKALYNLDYVHSMEKVHTVIFTMYVIIVALYIIFFIRAKQYKSKLKIVMLLCIIFYPFLINIVMKNIIEFLEIIFSFTPVNAYRNLFNRNINLTLNNDDDIYLHYSRVRDNQ